MAEETGAAFGIYPSAGRRPERLNQSRGVNAPLQLLRGWAAGTLGLPGDIEGLVRMLPGIKNETPVLPTSDFYREYLPGYDERPAARAMSGLGAMAGGVGATNVAGAGLGALKRATDVNAIRDYIRATQGVSGMPGAAVVKPRGGNWISGAGSPEEAVRGLKATAVGMDPAERIPLLDNLIREQEAAGAVTPEFLDRMRAERGRLTGDAELNRWIDQKLAKYIRNEMGTPEDPVRKLAERGVLHITPENVFLPSDTAFQRQAAGYPRHGVAKSQLATDWEVLADAPISREKAGNLLNAPWPDAWLAKVPPETPVYALSPGSTIRNENLGFSHLIDELRNATRAGSDLPRELQLKPEQLSKVSMPQAVELVDRINKWRAAQKAEADLARAGNAATVEYKTYDTVPGTALPNERGLRWVELRTPEFKAADQFSGEVAEAYRRHLSLGATEEQALKATSDIYGRNALEDALKYEGETMGHCVGGYCPDVIEGRSRIFSLRDAKGQPHVTVEVRPDDLPNKFSDLWDVAMRHVSEDSPGWDILADYGDDAYEVLKRHYGRTVEDPRAVLEGILQYFPEAMEKTLAELRDPAIIQIKGKANKAPKDEYLPYVQDFVRSGQWGRVGDLSNTGLIRIDPESDLAAAFSKMNRPTPGYVTQDELTSLMKWYRNEGALPEGFAEGGAVRAPAAGPMTYDPAAVEARAAALMEEIYA